MIARLRFSPDRMGLLGEFVGDCVCRFGGGGSLRLGTLEHLACDDEERVVPIASEVTFNRRIVRQDAVLLGWRS